MSESRKGQRRRVVVERYLATHPPYASCIRSSVRLSCGHIVLRPYHMAVGQTAYCAPCGEKR